MYFWSMTDPEYGRLQKWADELDLKVVDNNKTGWRRRWTVSLPDGTKLATDTRRSIALRKAQVSYKKNDV